MILKTSGKFPFGAFVHIYMSEKALKVFISEESHRQLKSKAALINKTMSEIVQELIDKWLAEFNHNSEG